MMNTQATPTAAGTKTIRKDETKSNNKSRFIRQRMDLPMGEKPAAKVIRHSQRRDRSIQSRPSSSAATSRSTTAKRSITKPTTPVLGAIVEREAGKNINLGVLAQPPNSLGFPSVGRPFGTFALKKKAVPFKSKSKNNTGTLDTTPSQKDADAMLAAMSNDEIQSSLDELHQSLNPETLAFLKKRGQKKNQEPKTIPKKRTAKKSLALASDATASAMKEEINKYIPLDTADEMEEKKRMANLLSSVKTFQEMDKLYEQEMGSASLAENALDRKDEFEQACVLLRSSAPRQTLWATRKVCERLESDLQSNKSFAISSAMESSWPYPSLLPVSLRCLLDVPTSQTNGLEIHSYALRSLYALMKLRAPSSHCVDITTQSLSPASVYQTHFLDDAVPTVPIHSLYSESTTSAATAKPMLKNERGEAVAYSTGSSSSSAQDDATSFLKDPMWTLLTKMKMIPRLGDFLRISSPIPDKALISISGILAMLAMRSPGAATAIAQHKIVLPSLLRRTIMPPNEQDGTNWEGQCNFLNPTLSLPAIILLNILARQSRVVAALIPFDSIVPPLLAVDTTEPGIILIQKWGLILWRKLLRYGMAIFHLPSTISLSIGRLTKKSSLAPQFLSCFGAILDCVKITAGRTTQAMGTKAKLTREEIDMLASSLEWLLPTAKICAGALLQQEEATLDEFIPACTSFLESFVVATTHLSLAKADTSGRVLSFFNESTLISNLWHFVSSEFFETTLRRISVLATRIRVDGIQADALAHALIDSTVSLFLGLDKLREVQNVLVDSKEPLTKIEKRIIDICIEWLKSAVKDGAGDILPWVIQCQYIISKLLSSSTMELQESDRAVIRLFVFNLIGRLRRGDEAKLVILVSNDSLFQGKENEDATSPLSSMFIHESCSSPDSKAQVDHSFKLHRGFGLTPQGWGPFDKQSLLSESDRLSKPTKTSGAGGLLPLGHTWLWQVLLGSGQMTSKKQAINSTTDVKRVLTSCLELLISVEKDVTLSAEIGGSFDSVPRGSKVFYLLNVCLHPEEISANQRIGELTSELLASILCGCRDDESLGADFAHACRSHSGPGLRDELTNKFLKGNGSWRAVEEFLVEFCNVFADFGAQYEWFSQCARCLFRPLFGSKIQIEVMKRLREVLHLLTPEESNLGELLANVSICIRHGVSDGTNSYVRDSGDLLDYVCNILKEQNNRPGFFRLYATSLVARNLASAIITRQGLQAYASRFNGYPPKLIGELLRSARCLVGSVDASPCNIVKAVHSESLKASTAEFDEIQAPDFMYFGASIANKLPSLR